MKLSYVSTSSIREALRYSMSRMQADLVSGQKEVQSGKVADTGLALGVRTSKTVSLSRDIDRLKAIIDSNTLVSSRLTTTQDSLSQISDAASTFLTAMTSASSGNATPETSRQAAVSMLEALTGIVNSSFNGEHIFAGVNTDVVPLADYFASGSPAKAAFDAAFEAEFGFAQSDAAAADITPEEMTAFMDGAASDLFLGAGWSAVWSEATDQGITTRIALNETAETSVSANNEGIRKLVMAATMVANLFEAPLNDQTLGTIAKKATLLVGEAMGDIAQTQAKTGFVEQRITQASARITMQSDIFKDFLHDLEGVDPYEASTRVNALISQIETSYALTARIQQLSLTRLLS